MSLHIRFPLIIQDPSQQDRKHFEASLSSFDGLTRLRSGDDIDISILCITYNHIRFIERTLEGFLKQRFDGTVEILIFDDHSSDGTQEVLSRWASAYPDLIKLCIQPYNKFSCGEGNPLEFFDACRGRYIAYCEGDDFWLRQDKLQRQFDVLERDSSVALVYSSAFFVDQHDQLIRLEASKSVFESHSSLSLEVGVNILTLTSMFRNTIQLPASVIGKNIYLDMIIWSACGEKGCGVFLDMNDPAAAAYRVHRGGLNSGSGQLVRTRMTRDTFRLLAVNKLRRARWVGLLLLLRSLLASLRMVRLWMQQKI